MQRLFSSHLAEAVWTLLQHVIEEPFLSQLFEDHRGTGSDQKVGFALLVRLVSDALLEHRGSGRQSFQAAREAGQLTATDAAAYGKLRRVPLELSEAFLRQATARLRQVLPEGLDVDVPPSVRAFRVLIVDGKKLKKLPKRLGALRQVRGRVLGGKVVVGLLLNEGLVVTMHASPDGEANDAPLTPGLLDQCLQDFGGRHLYVADRQFCDLTIPRRMDERGHAFLIRYSRNVSFFPERQQEFRDSQGRQVREALGWLGGPRQPRRMYVRHITLVREGEEDVSLITNLLDAQLFPTEELLEVYLARWTVERVFQQITEVFHLQAFIGSTPQGAIFQFALCGLFYNLIQAVRGYIALAQERSPRSLSSEMIFSDVCDQLTAGSLLLPRSELLALLAQPRSAEQVKTHLQKLLRGPWSKLWIKSPAKKKPTSTVKRAVPGNHSSAWKLIQQARGQPPPR